MLIQVSYTAVFNKVFNGLLFDKHRKVIFEPYIRHPHTIQYNTIQYNTMRYNTIQNNPILGNTYLHSVLIGLDMNTGVPWRITYTQLTAGWSRVLEYTGRVPSCGSASVGTLV